MSSPAVQSSLHPGPPSSLLVPDMDVAPSCHREIDSQSSNPRPSKRSAGWLSYMNDLHVLREERYIARHFTDTLSLCYHWPELSSCCLFWHYFGRENATKGFVITAQTKSLFWHFNTRHLEWTSAAVEWQPHKIYCKTFMERVKHKRSLQRAHRALQLEDKGPVVRQETHRYEDKGLGRTQYPSTLSCLYILQNDDST